MAGGVNDLLAAMQNGVNALNKVAQNLGTLFPATATSTVAPSSVASIVFTSSQSAGFFTITTSSGFNAKIPFYPT